jgi:hypothetical protein
LLEKICSDAKLVKKQPTLELIFDSDYGNYILLCEVIEGNLKNAKSKSEKKGNYESR